MPPNRTAGSGAIGRSKTNKANWGLPSPVRRKRVPVVEKGYICPVLVCWASYEYNTINFNYELVLNRDALEFTFNPLDNDRRENCNDVSGDEGIPCPLVNYVRLYRISANLR